MGEERTEGEQGKAYLTVGEAAKLLGVHRNTVRNRIKAGRIRAHKVLEDEQEIYRIERDSLDDVRTSAHVRTMNAHRAIEGSELVEVLVHRLEEIVQGYGRELGEVREQLSTERAKREQAEKEARRLREELEAERSKGFWRRLFGGY
jgi:excisionase family DNA binding protein